MANGFNQVTILGNVAADAVLKKVGEKETPRLTFRLIANTRRGNQEWAEGFNCVLWGRRAEALAPYITQGKRLLVQGPQRTRSYEDDEGQTHDITEIWVDTLVFQPQPRKAEEAEEEPEVEEGEEDFIPF